MADAYVKQLLVDGYGEELGVPDEGGYLVPVGSGVRVWVVDGNHRSRRVLVTAPLLRDVEVDLELFDALNDLNAVTPYGRYYEVDGEVTVEDTLVAEDLEPSAFYSSISFVAWAAETQAGQLARRIAHVEDVPDVGPSATMPAVDLEERTTSLVGDAPSTHTVSGSPRPTVSAGGYL